MSTESDENNKRRFSRGRLDDFDILIPARVRNMETMRVFLPFNALRRVISLLYVYRTLLSREVSTEWFSFSSEYISRGTFLLSTVLYGASFSRNHCSWTGGDLFPESAEMVNFTRTIGVQLVLSRFPVQRRLNHAPLDLHQRSNKGFTPCRRSQAQQTV